MTTGKTIAVTGATGFVGREVVKQLLARGHAVRALCRCLDKARATLPADLRLAAVVGDALDGRAPSELLRGADACLNLIGIIRAQGSRQTFERMHVEVPRVLTAACAAAGVRRFVHMSALGVSADGKAEYQRSKFEGEQVVRRSGLDWTIFRPGLIHGAAGELTGMVRDWCQGTKQPFFFVPHFVRTVEHDEGVPCARVSFESPAIAPVGVADVAACFVNALDRAATIGEVYNVVGGQTLTFKQMLAWCKEHFQSADATLPLIGVPGTAASVQATVAKFIGLGGLLPFDEGMPLMAIEDSTADLTKLREQVGIEPAGFEAVAAGYARSM